MKKVLSNLENHFIKLLRFLVIGGIVLLLLSQLITGLVGTAHPVLYGLVIMVVAFAAYKINQYYLNRPGKDNLDRGRYIHNHKTRSTSDNYKQIVNDYGRLKGENPEIPGLLYDAYKLPHPKEKIKEACIWALKNTDDVEMIRALIDGYIELANYQDGIEDLLVKLDIKTFYELGDNTSALLKGGDESKPDAGSIVKWFDFHKERKPIIEREVSLLKNELNRNGFDV